MELVKDIILQITFVVLPIFIYHLLWLSRNNLSSLKPNKLLITCGSIFSSVLCLIYPIELIDGAFFTLQPIPLFTSVVYGGSIPGLLTLLTTSIYFSQLYELGWVYFCGSITVYIILSLSLRSNWYSYTFKKKLNYAAIYGISILIFSLCTIIFVSVLYPRYVDLANYVIPSITIFTLTLILILCIYLIEYIRANAVMRMELMKAEKLSIVSELAASVAHEVRNPLTVVRGFVQLIGNSTNSTDSQRREYMDLVLTELDRAQAIITDYLGMAGQKSMAKEKINLTNTLNDITTLMTSYANYKTVKFKCDIDKDLYVFGDPIKLKQVFVNIIKNSIEAVPNMEGLVTIHACLLESTIHIKISDNGIGMTKEQIERLGEPYYSSKDDGTGLGLTVTYSIVKSHGGSVKYISEVNKGTVAIISLPLYFDTSSDHSHLFSENLSG
ncbi:HAMP domain-containing histidine kinase [Metabacillus litoralis]|nr:HAMP domain-containing sensor histidine kinase [Metabacillus litoralis]MCM3161117.1 HAMP domain-containing histidine kinase [Metabacillus litoralis]UHA61995.1 HAMP domain-containing histidine kinase [Metabacillus litoralis]